jgi:hypothetical protein
VVQRRLDGAAAGVAGRTAESLHERPLQQVAHARARPEWMAKAAQAALTAVQAAWQADAFASSTRDTVPFMQSCT